jgi:hypothetical protein
MIELNNWAAYKFGEKEIRLCGYFSEEGRFGSLMTEPIMTIDPNTGIVVTADAKEYRPLNRMPITGRMDMMYVVGRFCDLNVRQQPSEVTEMIIEALTKKEETE